MGATMNQRELEKLYRELQERKAKGIYKSKRSTSSSSAISAISQLSGASQAFSTTSSTNRYTPWHDAKRAEEYLQSASCRLTRKQLRNCLRNPRAVHEQFWEIPMNHPDKVEVSGSGMKNRYRTIIPNEHSRVSLPEADGDTLSTYINANYIRGYGSEPRAFIATQGPMANTVVDFWRLVWHERSPIVIMITKLREKNRNKCECYLPEGSALFGEIEVTTTSVLERNGYILTNLTMKKGEEEHKLQHYWYTAWPDHKAPSTARTLLDLVKLINQQRIDPTTGKVKGPVIVHCSAGIGRTGCFIATSVGIETVRQEQAVDILKIVCNMRLDRGGMIQTNEQYEFVHQTLMLYEKELPEEKTITED